MSEEKDGDISLTTDELVIFDEITELVRSLWEKSVGMEGLNTDPKMFSNALFKRLWSNHRGYALLWKDNLLLEADIVLRSALEAAICISALSIMGDEFVALIKRDAAFTISGQIKVWRDDGATKLVSDGEANLRMMQKGFAEGTKAAKLDFKELAAIGKVPLLYSWHRTLSGVSSHVTGLSLMNGFGGEGLNEKHAELRKLNKKMHLMMMAGASLQGCLHHAIVIEQNEIFDAAMTIGRRMDALSLDWPGVEKTEEDGATAASMSL